LKFIGFFFFFSFDAAVVAMKRKEKK